MRSFTILAAFFAAASAAPSVSPRDDGLFTPASPGGIEDVVVTQENTINGTYHSAETQVIQSSDIATRAISAALPLKFVNNASNGQVYAYVTGLDSDNKVVFIKGDGTLVYPSSGGSGAPVALTQYVSIALPGQGSTFQLTLPIIVTSGRIYFAEGKLSFFMVRTGTGGDGVVQPSPTNLKDPSSGTNWGFVEFTYTTDKVLYANISYVDFVGMILSMSLTVKNGATQTTRGLGAGSVSKICSGLADQGNSDKFPWSKMCIANSAGQPLRALAPNTYDSINPADFQNYWSGYVDQVWTSFSQNPLTIDTQSPAGKVQCKVSGTQLTCAGDNRGYNKPSAHDIWGCNSGPFERQSADNDIHVAVIPRLCAAFVRSTLLAAGGNNQPGPESSYYKTNPTHHYSRLVHQFEVDGKGYAFPYDDVNLDGHNAAGVVSSGSPDTWSIFIGAPPP
ncbi:Glucan endo-1,3-beta-glucosidase [Tolypocladium ophioglossoides CBS 100239]|uniref:Glucan endo-1,3-beta-glucosidase n=1 Tax=Tolypocladium ophioglossoides (strain CBS 100239) TaxID=1163406 RepID=A0A0L0ND66_TOLOC|nr:Glucan endo-1,3-beta-glucosidase [Tolypocladium ophioglossoides CBS 100239]